MLSELHIENIAVIERADITFAPGFNVLTGETGAGKSIVIDAIGAVTGERTSRDLIRTGAKSAVVSALFCGLPKLPWMKEAGIEPDGEGKLELRREISPDGKNLCTAGDRTLTVTQLRHLGTRLINIHGQHDGQLLLDETCHLEYLDRFARNEDCLSAYRETYDRVMDLERRMKALQMDEAEKVRRMDTLRYQIAELERAKLQQGEEEALSERRKLLRNASKLGESLERSFLLLSGDDLSDGAAALLSEAEGLIRDAAACSGLFSGAADKLSQLCALADDVSEELRALRGEFEFSPEELEEVEARLDVLYRLKKKYGASVAEMLSYLERCRSELEQITCSEETVKVLERERDEALREAKEKAGILSAARQKAAAELESRICTELRDLDMGNVCFSVEFDAPEGEMGLDRSGMDKVRFLMSANVGEAMKSISRVASGGELARIMLAMKNVLAENDDVGTLVFDEVDTGVSGRAARRVAEKLAVVAGRKQVLCVTHLPQIAAMADVHFCVEKEISGGRTFTRVRKLDRDGRREALAGITGGVEVTEAMKQSAEELLCSAETYKQTVLNFRNPSNGLHNR